MFTLLINLNHSFLKTLLTVLFLLSIIESKAQIVPKQAIVTTKVEMRTKLGLTRTLIDTFLVRNNFILEPIKKYYSTDETTLSTTDTKSSRKEISSGSKLSGYCFTNLQEMMGMAFNTETTPSAKTILPYKFSPDNPKKGTTFTNEPFLARDLTPNDYVKEKDTIINGQQCFFIKRTKVIQNVYKGMKLDKIVQFRLAINPKLPFYAFPYVSEKITKHFGGGAIVYMDGITQRGYRSIMHYSYSEFTNADDKLFDHYQELYNSNITLLDKFKSK